LGGGAGKTAVPARLGHWMAGMCLRKNLEQHRKFGVLSEKKMGKNLLLFAEATVSLTIARKLNFVPHHRNYNNDQQISVQCTFDSPIRCCKILTTLPNTRN